MQPKERAMAARAHSNFSGLWADWQRQPSCLKLPYRKRQVSEVLRPVTASVQAVREWPMLADTTGSPIVPGS